MRIGVGDNTAAYSNPAVIVYAFDMNKKCDNPD